MLTILIENVADLTGFRIYSSSRYLTIDFTPATRAKAYPLLDSGPSDNLKAGLKIYVFGRNLTNRRVYTGAFTQSLLPSLTLASLGAPRTYGLGLSTHF